MSELRDEVQLFQGDPNRPMMIDRDGRPMSLAAWAEAFEDTESRIIASDVVGNHEVRTMWHGVTGGDFLCGWSTNTEIFGSIICTRNPAGEFLPDLSLNGDGAVTRMRTAFGREILTGTIDDALAAHQELLDELREGTST